MQRRMNSIQTVQLDNVIPTGTDTRELLYPWHAWAGQRAFVHGSVKEIAEVHFSVTSIRQRRASCCRYRMDVRLGRAHGEVLRVGAPARPSGSAYWLAGRRWRAGGTAVGGDGAVGGTDGGSLPIPNGCWWKVQSALTVPTIYDRVCQQALVNRLQPIFDPSSRYSMEANLGYRRGRSTKDALRKVWKEIEAGNEWIVDADLRDFFGSAEHEKIVTLVSQ